MKKIINYLLIAITIMVIGGCEKDGSYFKESDILVVNNNISVLNQRMNNVDKKLPLFTNGTLKSVGSLELKLIAELNSPKHNGDTLQASHIQVVGNYVYVTYNTQGEKRLGGIDIINISNPLNPEVISYAYSDGYDISSIDVDPKGVGNNAHVYVVGGKQEDDLETDALIERFTLNSQNQFKHVNSPRQYYDLVSYMGTDVRFFDDVPSNKGIFVTSGDVDGKLTILNAGMNYSNDVEIFDARSVDVNSNYVAVFSGVGYYPNTKVAKLSIYNHDLVLQKTIETGGADIAESKSMVRLKDNLAFVALGKEGMHVYDLITGNLLANLDVDNDTDPINNVTNGVAINNDLFFVANGGAGVSVGCFNNNTIESVGYTVFDDGSSANYVDSKNNLIFVATGKHGLKIIEIVTK